MFGNSASVRNHLATVGILAVVLLGTVAKRSLRKAFVHSVRAIKARSDAGVAKLA